MPVSHVVVAPDVIYFVLCTDPYFNTCRQLVNEQTTLFLYVLLQGNANFSSFVFSRSDIHQLVSTESDIIDGFHFVWRTLSLSLSFLFSLRCSLFLRCSLTLFSLYLTISFSFFWEDVLFQGESFFPHFR